MKTGITATELLNVAAPEDMTIINLTASDLADYFDETQKIISTSTTELAGRFEELDNDQTYYLVANNTFKAQQMSHFLSEAGYDAYYLIGGFASLPREQKNRVA